LYFEPNNQNSAVLEVRNPIAFSICYETNLAGEPIGRLTADILVEVFVEIAIACAGKKTTRCAGWLSAAGMGESGFELKSNKESNTLMSC
jgi:hypothetical protein